MTRLGALALLVLLVAGCGGTPALPTDAGPTSDHRVGEPGSAPTPAAAPAGTVVPVGPEPEGVAVDPKSGLVAVDLRSPNAIAVLDSDGRVQRTIPVPAFGRHLRFGGPGLLLAPLEASRTLAEVDVASGTILAEVPLGKQPHDAVAAGGRFFVGNEFSDTLAVVKGTTVQRELPAPMQPGGVAATPNAVVVVGVRSHLLEAFDTRTLASLGTVAAGAGPTHLDASGPLVYETDTLGDAVRVFSVRPHPRQVAAVPAQGRPLGIALDAVRHRLWVTLSASNMLVEYDVTQTKPRLLATYPTVQQANTVAVDAHSGRVWVTGKAAGVLELIDPTV
ncbi:MAG: YncE family protein [Candidatus Dormibacteraeota bacterium]|nr:YncE family protein [Candidatus Dormibacteraeota bacterium]